MDETKQKNEETLKTKAETTSNNNDGELSIYEKTLRLKQELTELVNARAIQLDREERMRAEQLLGGGSEGGQAPVAKKEISNKEYAEQALSGTLKKCQ